MHKSRRPCMSGGGDALVMALLRRWREARAAPPHSATAPTTNLLQETLTHLRLTAPMTPEVHTPAPSSPAPQSSPPSSSPAATTLFTAPANAQLIWGALQRQRVAWQAALQLLPWQLDAMSSAQVAFVQRRVSTTPWDVAQVALTAADLVEDADLVQAYRAMKHATHMVELARLVTAALRERPDLPGGLLPVSYGVLLHAYMLGGRSPQAAAIALAVTKHVRLLGRAALSRAAEERLVLGHAAVLGQVGEWAAALAVVEGSRAVRLSARKDFACFVESVQPDGVVNNSSSSHRGTSRVTATASTARAEWALALATFLAQPPEQQSFTAARGVLAALPTQRTQQPDFILLATAVLRHAATRMYAGTLTRRLAGSARRADWTFALSLATAARCYDVAAPLLPFVPSAMAVPDDLRDFCQAVEGLKKAKAAVTPPGLNDSTLVPLTRATAAAGLSYPEALAHALEGCAASRRMLLSSCPHAQPLSPLRSLLLATKVSCVTADDDSNAVDDIDCCTFQSSALSRLVCAAASAKRQRYFYKVLPASMRAHHFATSPMSTESLPGVGDAAAGGADPVVASQELLQRWRWQTATTPAACAAVLSDLSAFLRATHAVEGEPVRNTTTSSSGHAKPRLTEEVYLRSIATLVAWGAVQLPATERFHWPLAVLKAAWLLRVTVDASLIVATTRNIPSPYLDHAALAVPSVLAAHTLLGQWQTALQMCARLTRREKEGTLRLEADPNEKRPHTVKYTPPPPTLREAMAQVGYAAPKAAAVQHWNALEASSFSVLLIELKVHADVRQVCDELRRLTARSTSHRRNTLLENLSQRRMLLGAAFMLLDEEGLLRQVLQAARQSRVRAEDLDDHGLQRLLGVLSSAAVSRVLMAEVAAGRCAQEHWLLHCMCQPTLSLAEVRSLAGLRPTSTILSAVCCACAAIDKKDAVLCLKALRRVAERALESPARNALLFSIAHLLRRFLASEALLQLCVQQQPQQQPPSSPRAVEGNAKDNRVALASSVASATVARQILQEAQLLYNRMQEMEQLSALLKNARNVVRSCVDQQRTASAPGPSSCAVWVILTVLHTATCRALHLPVPAAFSSHLLRCAVATDVSDWQAALVFFNALRQPTNAERVVLVQALRHAGATATTLLLRHRRFMRQLPEQVMLWVDEAGGRTKWERSIALLLAQEKAANAMEEKVREGSSVPARETAGEGGGESGEKGPLRTRFLSPEVEALMVKWNADECFRAAQLLRRQGFVYIPEKPERSLQQLRILETEPFARRQVEAVVELLRRRTAAAPSPAAPVPLADKNTPPSGRRAMARGVAGSTKPTPTSSQ